VIKIVRTSTLASLQRQALRELELSGRLADADRRMQAAEAASLRAQEAQSGAEAELKALWDDMMAGLCRLETATGDPRTGSEAQAEIALRYLRGQIAKVKATGNADLIDSMRVLDHLIGEGVATPETASEHFASCGNCPMPYYPGGPVPCVAAERCIKVPRPHADRPRGREHPDQ
jgi:glutamate-1-semialdehyde aminotransferase